VWHPPAVLALDPPRVSRRLFWAVVASCIGLFGLGATSILVLRLPTERMMVDARLLRTILLEALLAAAWVPVLRRRGWSLGSVTMPAEFLDLARGLGILVVSYAAYWSAFMVVGVAFPAFVEMARNTSVGGAPSWFVVVLVSVVNPIAEEFLLLGFIANVLRSDGFHLALAAAVLARTVPHVYQGPVGLVSAIAIGVVFGAYYLRSGRLWPVILAHCVSDLVGLGRLVGGAA
jgi:membrane protease YdiL (CAAX protease family)